MSDDKRQLVTYWSLILDSAKALGLAFATVISVLFGIVVWILAKDDKLPAWIVVPVALVLIFAVVVHADALRVAAKRLAFGSIRARGAKASHPDLPGCDCVCVVETAAPLSLHTQLSLFFTDDEGYEYDLGTGIIRRLQEGGSSLVSVHCRRPGDPVIDKFMARLKNGQAEAVKALRISVSITQPRYAETKEETLSNVGAAPASGAPGALNCAPAVGALAAAQPGSSSSTSSETPPAPAMAPVAGAGAGDDPASGGR